jgi:hypothetical protein
MIFRQQIRIDRLELKAKRQKQSIANMDKTAKILSPTYNEGPYRI